MSMKKQETRMTHEEFSRVARIAVMYGKIETIERFPQKGYCDNSVTVGVSVTTGMPVINPGSDDVEVGTVEYSVDDSIDVSKYIHYDDAEYIRGYEMYEDAYEQYKQAVERRQEEVGN